MISNGLKVFILIISCCLLGFRSADAQTQSRPAWLSFYGAHQEYRGDFGNEMLDFKIGYDWMLGLNLNRYLNPLWDIELSLAYGELDYLNAFSTSLVSTNFLANIKPWRNKTSVTPFFGAGLGFSTFWTESVNNSRDLALQLPIQAGIAISLSSHLQATFKTRYNRTFSSKLDGSDFNNRKHDDFLVYSVGLSFSLNRTKDKDNDGIPDKDDLCPDRYGTSFWGCPDTDGDGLEDNEDECPGIFGTSLMNGCPDSDGDRVTDSEDQCPDLKGPIRFNGCPDEDNDGVPDPVDECPETPGIGTQNGCPDVNATHTEDRANDADRTVASLSEELATLSANIVFAPNSIELDSASQNSIRQVAEIMLEDPDLRLIIRAYTDNTGNSVQNLNLSIARANAVKAYLAKQGVSESRVYAFGYGDKQPIAPNTTPEGRAKNRRIELNLYYN